MTCRRPPESHTRIHCVFAVPSLSSWSGKPSERGADAYTVVGLPLAEAVTGTQKMVVVKLIGTCPDCQVRTLSTCHARG